MDISKVRSTAVTPINTSPVRGRSVVLSYQPIDGYHDEDKLAQCRQELLEIPSRDFIRQHYVPWYKDLPPFIRRAPEYQQFMRQDSMAQMHVPQFAQFYLTQQKKLKTLRLVRPAPQKEQINRFHGQFIHINLAPQQISEAFDAIRPIVFSEESPVFDWSVSLNNEADSGQITLYIKPNQERNRFGIHKIAELSDFLWRIEIELVRANLIPGQIPYGDIQCTAWRFCSYCDERLISRHTQHARIRQQAYEQDPLFYLLAFSAQNRSHKQENELLPA